MGGPIASNFTLPQWHIANRRLCCFWFTAPSCSWVPFIRSSSIGSAKRPQRVIDRSGQSYLPVHVCFRPESGLGAAAAGRKRVEVGHKPVIQAPKLGNFESCAMNLLPPITLPSSSSHQYGCGCASMGPRPRGCYAPCMSSAARLSMIQTKATTWNPARVAA